MKARKALIWFVGVPLALYAIAYAARFQTTKPIEGVLVATTPGDLGLCGSSRQVQHR